MLTALGLVRTAMAMLMASVGVVAVCVVSSMARCGIMRGGLVRIMVAQRHA
jgi:hypothetical protein